MAALIRSKSRFLRFLYRSIILLSLFSLAGILLLKLEAIASRVKTVAGHNLDPTPWHPFPPKSFEDESQLARASKIIKCSYLSCAASTYTSTLARSMRGGQRQSVFQAGDSQGQCPDFFTWIYRDLEPWSKSRISMNHLMRAKDFAAFRVVIVDGRLYVEYYYACVQSRALFTVWNFLQLLKRSPGLVSDVNLMFDCMD